MSMEFQYIDSNMDYYITKFKEHSFILKDENLQKGNINKPTTNKPTTNKPTITKTTSKLTN